ncbi:hypothetical protein E4U40_007989 [Claviceps sp. LM458 group G5]|nr:hypothetical protein E4U40_007989 [Claviceps sp. LM458 group G5]
MSVRQSADLENLSATDLEVLALDLLYGLENHPAGEMLHQIDGERVSYVSWVVIFPNAVRYLKPLLAAAINQADNKNLWKQVKKFIFTNSRYLYTITLFSHNEAFEANSSEHREDVDSLMREEVGQIHVDIPQPCTVIIPTQY